MLGTLTSLVPYLFSTHLIGARLSENQISKLKFSLQIFSYALAGYRLVNLLYA